jgi:DNA-binding transcriptional LysR family regulator
MENLAALRSLVAAAHEGSLSAAARRLRITQSAVSQQIAGLEQTYGLDLVIRGRNGIILTEAGALAVDHATGVLARMDQMAEALAALHASGEGRLILSCALLLSQTVLVPVLADLRQTDPGLKIDVKANDAVLDLAASGADIAIRAGSPGPGGGIVRKLAEIEQVLVASPAYLDRVGRPNSPQDLARLDYIQYKDDPEETHVLMENGERAPVTAAFAAQLPNLICHAVQNHLGFAKAPRFFVDHLIRAGEMEVLFPEEPMPKPLYLIRSERHQGASRRIEIFVSRFVAELARRPGFRLASDLRPASAA